MFCVVKSKTIKYVLIVLLATILLAISINGAVSAEVFFGYSTRKVPIYCVDTQKAQVAISFDAAWGADKTKQIVDICKEYNVRATFFLVGFWVDKYGDMVKYIDDNGFEIGTHTNTHPDMVNLSADAQSMELDKSIELITNITGKEVELFRAPFGSYNNTLLDTAESKGLKTIQWDVDSLDWKGLSAEAITLRILNGVKNGSIILCHNNSDHIVEALPMVLDRLTKKGYKVGAVGDLIYKDNYTIDRTGLQKTTI
ncbi:MAG: polysaccharide deacetylase family protein [Clostridia bacterium]|nr:polysaccharide deacetylase family protein [Clostridia bacterium]